MEAINIMPLISGLTNIAVAFGLYALMLKPKKESPQMNTFKVKLNGNTEVLTHDELCARFDSMTEEEKSDYFKGLKGCTSLTSFHDIDFSNMEAFSVGEMFKNCEFKPDYKK